MLKFIFRTMMVKLHGDVWILGIFESSEGHLLGFQMFLRWLQLRRTSVLQYVSSKVWALNASIVLPLLHHKHKRGYPFQHLSHAGEFDAEFSKPEHHSGTGTGRHLGISIQTITNIAQEELTLKTLNVCVLNMNEEECVSRWQSIVFGRGCLCSVAPLIKQT